MATFNIFAKSHEQDMQFTKEAWDKVQERLDILDTTNDLQNSSISSISSELQNQVERLDKADKEQIAQITDAVQDYQNIHVELSERLDEANIAEGHLSNKITTLEKKIKLYGHIALGVGGVFLIFVIIGFML